MFCYCNSRCCVVHEGQRVGEVREFPMVSCCLFYVLFCEVYLSHFYLLSESSMVVLSVILIADGAVSAFSWCFMLC